MCGIPHPSSGGGGILGGIGPYLDPVGGEFNKLTGGKFDVLNVYGHPPPPGMTPQEQEAYNLAQPYLAEYESGKLNANDQALVNQGDTNSTAAALQSFASSGMSASSSQFGVTGKVTKPTATTGFQAGSGSGIDLQKASNTQAILSQDLQNGLAYLGVAAGDAQALTAVNLSENAQVVASLGAASASFGQIFGNQPPVAQIGGPSDNGGANLTSTYSGSGDYADFSTNVAWQPYEPSLYP